MLKYKGIRNNDPLMLDYKLLKRKYKLEIGYNKDKVNEMLIGVYNAITKPNVYCPIFIMCGGM